MIEKQEIDLKEILEAVGELYLLFNRGQQSVAEARAAIAELQEQSARKDSEKKGAELRAENLARQLNAMTQELEQAREYAQALEQEAENLRRKAAEREAELQKEAERLKTAKAEREAELQAEIGKLKAAKAGARKSGKQDTA